MIIFRDRSLKQNEKFHHYCTECGQELHPDFAYSHKCDPIVKALNDMGYEWAR